MAVWTLGVAGQSELGTTTFLGAAGPADIPSLRVEVSFTAAPGANPVWQDISAYVRSGSLRRGRQRELDKFQAGTATVVLDNRTRTFDPSYSAGPYFGNIKPMKRMRIYAIFAGIQYPLFDGYVDNWAQHYQNPLEATCIMTATDGFKVLAIQALSSAYAVEVLADAPSHWWRLGEAVGTASAIDAAGTTNGTYSAAGVTLASTSLIVNDSNTSAAFNGTTGTVTLPVAAVPNSPYTIEMWIKIPTWTGSARVPLVATDSSGSAGAKMIIVEATASDAGSPNIILLNINGDGAGSSIVGTKVVNDNLAHHVVITRDSSNLVSLFVDGVADGTRALTGTGEAGTFQFALSPLTIPNFGYAVWNGTLDEVAIYPTALSATRIAAHNTAGRTPWTGDFAGARITRILNAVNWPTADRNIFPGLSTLQAASISGSALTHAQAVELTEAGLLFMSNDGKATFIDRTQRYATPTSGATFGDSGAEIGYQTFAYDVQDQPISNDVVVTRTGGSAQEAKDATSISDYYTRTLSLSGMLHQTDTISQSRAQFEVANRKDLLERVTMLEVMPMFSPTTYFPAVLVRELNDAVTVNRRPQGVGSVVSQLSHIEGIQHEFAPRHWKSSFYVSSVSGIATDGTSVSKQYWVLGVAGASELGQTTRLGF